MTDASDPRAVLKELQQRAKKRFGQHFLARPTIVHRMIRIARVTEGDKVIEIGPGLGILTHALLQTGCDLTAIEIDDDLYEHIQRTFPDVNVVHVDALKADWETLAPGPGHKLVANLPYNVGTHLVMNCARMPERFSTLTVMLQKEVIDRMVAGPGSKAYGALSVHLQVRGDVRHAFDVPPGAFIPPPKVHSAIVHAELYDAPKVGDVAPDFFDKVVTAAFGQRRKTLRNALTPLFGKDVALQALADAGIRPDLRAERLEVAGFLALADALHRIRIR